MVPNEVPGTVMDIRLVPQAAGTRSSGLYITWLLLPSFLLVLLCSDVDIHRAIAIPINPLQVYPIAIAIGVFYLLGRLRTIRLDGTSLLLLMRIPLLLLPLAYTADLDGYVGNYLAVLVTAFAYTAGASTQGADVGERLYRFIVVVGLVIVVQMFAVISAYVAAGFPVTYLKSAVDIPIGRSNSIASYLLIVFFFLLVYMRSSPKRTVFLVVVLAALLMTFSTGAALACALVLGAKALFAAKIQAIRAGNLASAALAAALIAVTVLALDSFLSGAALRIFDRVRLLLSEDEVSINELSSGRLELFAYSFGKFLRHPVLGNGLGFPPRSYPLIERMRPHNLVLEALTQGGLVNLLNVAGALGVALRRVVGSRGDRVNAAILWGAIAVLCHGLVEPNLFSYSMDYFFWSLIGIGVGRARYLAAAKTGGDSMGRP